MKRRRRGGELISTGDPRWRQFEADVRKNLIPQMRDSANVLMIAPDISSDFDVRFALQIGASVLLEKPLVLVVDGDRTVPPKLERIADRIIRADLSTPFGRQQVEREMHQFFTDFGKQ
jgi:hypothetical protein